MQKGLALSVIIPVSNEEKILEKQTRRLIEHTKEITTKFEIVFVENGSTDHTAQVIRHIQEHFDFVRLTRLDKADYSTAVLSGIMEARGQYSIVTGIDYVDLNVLNRCWQALKQADVVICSKNKGLDKRPLVSRLANRSYNAIVRLFFGLKHSDIEGYHGYDTKKVQSIISDVQTKAHLCNLWILLKAKRAGLRVDEVPLIVYEKRKSKFMRITRLPYLAAISVIELVKLKSKGY